MIGVPGHVKALAKQHQVLLVGIGGGDDLRAPDQRVTARMRGSFLPATNLRYTMHRWLPVIGSPSCCRRLEALKQFFSRMYLNTRQWPTSDSVNIAQPFLSCEALTSLSIGGSSRAIFTVLDHHLLPLV